MNRTHSHFLEQLRRSVFVVAVTFTLAGVALAQGDQLATGKFIFEEGAGGVGCAYCHGADAQGNGAAGLDAPRIVGASESLVRSALSGVPEMSFINLSDAEITAVVAYLQSLATPPVEPPAEAQVQDRASPAAEADTEASEEFSVAPAPELGDLPIRTINISISDQGYDPRVVQVSVGERVQLVIRNRTLVEHHYQVIGLVADDVLWLADPPDIHHEGVTDDEHEAHHATTYVPWRAPSMAGIQPQPGQVHAWAHAYAPGGGKDAIIFTPTVAGTFEVRCPLHPELQGVLEVQEAE